MREQLWLVLGLLPGRQNLEIPPQVPHRRITRQRPRHEVLDPIDELAQASLIDSDGRKVVRVRATQLAGLRATCDHDGFRVELCLPSELLE
jgi:hypothetical protein